MMDYQSIKETVAKFSYQLPIVASNEDGDQISVNEVYEDITILGEAKKIHCYNVFTYLKDGNVKLNRYYENGMTSEEIIAQ